MNKVLTVLVDNIPEVTAIDLSSNKLSNSSLEYFSTFTTKLVNLKILYLENNKISDSRNLQKFKGLKLEELKLTGNPLVNTLGSSYTEVIRKIFPTLKILDGKELPPVIGFEEVMPKQKLAIGFKGVTPVQKTVIGFEEVKLGGSDAALESF